MNQLAGKVRKSVEFSFDATDIFPPYVFFFILPICLILGLIRMVLWWRAVGSLNSEPPWPFIVVITGFSAWFVWIWWQIKKVSIFGDKLYVSNYLTEVAIPISEILDVRGMLLSDPQVVTIKLRGESEFGSKIRFLATYRWFGGWSTHPIVKELLDMVRSQTETGFLTRPPR
jgi:hypothetical protein